MSFMLWLFPVIIVVALAALLTMIYVGGRRNARKSQARRGSDH
jgi:hypothetical protein